MSVEWEREGSLFLVRASGSYPPQELARALEEIRGVADFPADAQVLLDVRESTSLLERSTGEIREIARNFADNSDVFGRRCALLVDGVLRYGLMRMASAWASVSGVNAAVFRDPAKARAWLTNAAQRHAASR